MKEMKCRKCHEYMYLPTPLRKGLDIYETPRNDGLEAELVCQGCGHQERGIFVFARFASDSLAPEEISYLHGRAQAIEKQLNRNKRIWVTCRQKIIDNFGEKWIVHNDGYLTCDHAASSYGLPVLILKNGKAYGPADLGPHEISEDITHKKDLADTAKMLARARDAGYNVKF